MLTPQEVSNHAFAKAVMGGYNMAMVDEFLDELTDDYTALYKENAALKAKMKVLVEKVEDYRATEDSMRATLLTAQKMAAKLVQEAQTEKENLLREAREQHDAQIKQLEKERSEVEEKLVMAKQSLVEFVRHGSELCAQQTEFLNSLPEREIRCGLAEIIKTDGGHGVVNVGSKVKILDDLNEETEYEIVGTTEADISVGRISNESPLGKALIGAKLGDTVTVKAPKCSYQVKILGIDG